MKRTRDHEASELKSEPWRPAKRLAQWGLVLGGSVASLACAAGDSTSDSLSASEAADFGPSTGVGQSGAQDFGAFREVVDRGELPAPELLDDVGFFNEHKVELPPANCGEAVCLHAELGVVGNLIDGSNCTMLFMGMNTGIDTSAIERPPLHIALALDTSGSMQGLPIDNLRIGLEMMLAELRPVDRVSLITFSSGAEVRVVAADRDSEELARVIATLEATGATDIYSGLSRAYSVLEEQFDSQMEQRVVLLSDGEATAGFVSRERIVGLARAYSGEGLSLSVIGVGDSFDVGLLRELATEASGSFYFLDSPLALREVFVEEIKTALVPLANDARITVTVEEDYRVREAYGVLHSTVSTRQARIEIPALQIAHRTSASDDESGRRGGGGVMIVELTPEAADVFVEGVPKGDHRVGSIEFSYLPRVGLDPETDAPSRITQTIDIRSPLAPGEIPIAGYFPNGRVEKSFVMLNLYAGMKAALDDVTLGDAAGALATLAALEFGVREWLGRNPDPDIEDDLGYLVRLQAVIETNAPPPEDVPEPRSPWPVD